MQTVLLDHTIDYVVNSPLITKSSHKPCKHGNACTQKNTCLFSHALPTQKKIKNCDVKIASNQVDSNNRKKEQSSTTTTTTTKTNKIKTIKTIKTTKTTQAAKSTVDCYFGNKCTDKSCSFAHPDESARFQCYFGLDCTNAECAFNHPTTTPAASTTPSITKTVSTNNATPIKINIPIMPIINDTKIIRTGTDSKKQPSKELSNEKTDSTKQPSKVLPAHKEKNHIICRNGILCSNDKCKCKFNHSPTMNSSSTTSTNNPTNNPTLSSAVRSPTSISSFDFGSHSNHHNYNIAPELITDINDKEIHQYLLQTYEFQQFLICFKLIMFQELTAEFSVPLVKKLSSLSARIHQIIDGYLFLYQSAKNANQSHYSTTISHKLKYMHQTIHQFRNDMDIIFSTLMPHWKTILAVIVQFYAHEAPSFNQNGFNSNLKQSKIDDTELVGQLSFIFTQDDTSNSSTNTKSIKTNLAKGGSRKSKLDRLTITQFASLIAFESDLALSNENIALHSIPTYSSTVFTQVETFIGVMATYFDSIDFLFTAPLAAFQLLTTIFQQESSYKISKTSKDIHSFLEQVQQSHIEGEADANERDTPDVRLDPDQGCFSFEDHEAKENTIVIQALDNTFDPNTFRGLNSQKNFATQENVASMIQQLISPHKSSKEPPKNLQSRTNHSKFQRNEQQINDNDVSDVDFSQKNLPSDCQVEIKALPVLLSMGTFFTSSKNRLIVCSSTGSGKSVLLPLIEVLLSYYDTTSLYYAFSTSASNITLPPNYLSSNLQPQRRSNTSIHSFESQLREKGFLHISKVKNGQDANWVLSIIIKHIIYCSNDPTIQQLRGKFLLNPSMTLRDEHIQAISHLPIQAMSLPLDLPFVFLLLPSRAIVNEKELYFTSRYKDVLSVITMTATSSHSTFLQSYSAFSSGSVTHTTPKLVLSTPEAFLRLLSRFFNLGQLLSRGNVSQLPTQYLFQSHLIARLKRRLDPAFIDMLKESMLNSCRVILDEAHERSVYLDVVLMTVAKLQHIKCLQQNTPFRIHQHMFTIMSATPDPDVYATLLEKYTETVTLTTRLLYNVTTKQIKSTQTRSINSDLVPQETVQMINSVMSARYRETNDPASVPPGDCLIFMAGQQECQTALIDICAKLIQSKNSNDTSVNYIILQTTFDGISSLKHYYDALLKEIKTHAAQIEPTFILPLSLTGKVAQLQKDIACAKLPSTVAKYRAFRNVFKIIAATNSVESSVTIDGLTMLVDSGLHKENVFDVDKGVSTLSLKSITEDSRTQRKGRVGRTQQASVVQIIFDQSQTSQAVTINNTGQHKPSSNHALPKLLSTDPAAIVIQLRLMGILLEQINEYLPSPLPKNNLATILNDLRVLDLITNDGLTPDGKLVAKLTSSFQPLYAATLVREFQIDPNRGYFAAIVLIAMTSFSDGLHFNQSSIMFSNIITDQHSNLVTLVSALLTVLAAKRQDSSHLTWIGIDEKSFKSAQLNFSTVCAAFSEIQNNIRASRSSDRIETAPILKSVCKSIGHPRFSNENHISNLLSASSNENNLHQKFLISSLSDLPERVAIHNRVDHVLRVVDASVKQSWLPSREFAFHSFDSTSGFAKYTATDHKSTLPSKTRVYPFQGANSELFKFPTRAHFLNKAINASFAQPFMILSTYHTYGNITNIDQIQSNRIQSPQIELTKCYNNIAHASQPDTLNDGLYNSVFAPSVFSLPLHDSFFTSPFSEILLNIYLGPRTVQKPSPSDPKKVISVVENSYKIELKSELARLRQVKQPEKQSKKATSIVTSNNLELPIHTTLTILSEPLRPRSYLEIGAILNRVRTLSPHFTQDVIMQRDENFFIHYQSSFYSSPSHGISHQVGSGLSLGFKSLFCSSMQTYKKDFFAHNTISPPPTIYPITQNTLDYHENCIANKLQANFYPIIIIRTSQFFNFFDHEKRLATPLTVDNIKVDYRALTANDKYILSSTNSTTRNPNNNNNTATLIAYVSTNGTLSNLKESPIQWSQRDSTIQSTRSQSIFLSGYLHSKIPSLIFEEQSDLQYWAYPHATPLYLVSGPECPINTSSYSRQTSQFSNIADYYEAEKERIDSTLHTFSSSSTLPWPPTAFHSFMKPQPDIFFQFPNQTRYLNPTPIASKTERFHPFYPKEHSKGFFKILDSVRLQHSEYFFSSKNPEVSPQCKQSFTLVSASKNSRQGSIGLNSPLELPDIPLASKNKSTISTAMSSPQPLHGVVRIRALNPLSTPRKSSKDSSNFDSVLQQFQTGIEQIVSILSPLVLFHKINTDKSGITSAELHLIDRTIIPWFVHCYAALFGVDLSPPQDVIQPNYSSPLNLNLQLPFREVPLSCQKLGLDPEDDPEDEVAPLTHSQLKQVFQQSTHCQQLYTNALLHFFTPYKSPFMAAIWSKRSLITLTPIFFSLKLPIYLTTTLSYAAQQFEVALQTAQLPVRILSSGAIYSQVPTLSKLLEFYSNAPTACEITHPILVDPSLHQNQMGQQYFSNDCYKALATTICPLLSSHLCLTLDDISSPIIYSNVCMVVFARHPYDHIENLHSLHQKSGHSLSKTISTTLNNSTAFEVHFGSQQDAICFTSDSNDAIAQKPYHYADIIEELISDIYFPNKDPNFPLNVALTRLFHMKRAIRYLSSEEIDDIELGQGETDDDDDEEDDDDDDDDDCHTQPLKNQIDTVQKVHSNVYLDYNLNKHFQLIPVNQDFMNWFHSKCADSSSQQNLSSEKLLEIHRIKRFEDKERWVTDFSGDFDVLHSNNFFFAPRGGTNIVKGFHIVSLRPDTDPLVINNLVKNTEIWCRHSSTTTTSITHYSTSIHDKLSRVCKRFPQFEESFHSFSEDGQHHLYLAYNSKYNSQVIKILTQLESKSKVNVGFGDLLVNVDDLYSSGCNAAYKTLAQIGFISTIHSGPEGDQTQKICNKMFDKDLAHRFPHLLPQWNDTTSHTFMCTGCDGPLHVRAPIYTQTHKSEECILSGLLPLISTVKSPFLSNLKTTPYIILPTSTLCFTCLFSRLETSINFISISPQNTLKIEDFTGDFLELFLDLFSGLTFEQTHSKSASIYFPIGAIILTIFDAINKGLSNNQTTPVAKFRHFSNKSSQQIFDPFFASLSCLFQTYLCSKVHVSFLTSTQQASDTPFFKSCTQHPFRYFLPETESHICNVLLPNGSRCDYRFCGDCQTYHLSLNCPRQSYAGGVATIRDCFLEKTPCCKQVFDFTDCCAVTCEKCATQFCAFCSASTTGNIHPHVWDCALNPDRDYFCDPAVRLAIVREKILRPNILTAFAHMDLKTRINVYEEIEQQYTKSTSSEECRPLSLVHQFKISLQDIQKM